MNFASSKIKEVMVDYLNMLEQIHGQNIPWLFDIRVDHDDAGTFIELQVDNNTYPKEDTLKRIYNGVPIIISRYQTKPIKYKN